MELHVLNRPAAPPLPVRTLFDVSIHAATLSQVVAQCRAAIDTRRPLMIGVVNAAKIVNMARDPLLRNSVCSADLVLADGAAVVWASWLLRQPLPERVAGIDLFEALLALAHDQGYSVYLLGAKQEVLEEVVRRIGARHPGIRIAGYRNGYFGDAEAPAVARDIALAHPDMLFVAMTSPKKETFLAHHAAELAVPVCHGVGGSFDVLAGKVARAPRTWQRLGLEWLYRVLQEPRRLWKRYLVTNSAFIAMVARAWLLRWRKLRH